METLSQSSTQLLIVNELLCYLNHKHGNINAKSLKATIFNFYLPEAILIAKELVINSIDNVLSDKWPRPAKRRINSKDVEGRSKTDLDDIFAMYAFIDEQNLSRRLPIYVAVNLNSVPSHSMTEGDASAIMNKLELLNEKINNIAEFSGSCEASLSTITDGSQKTIAIVSDISGKLPDLNTRRFPGSRSATHLNDSRPVKPLITDASSQGRIPTSVPTDLNTMEYTTDVHSDAGVSTVISKGRGWEGLTFPPPVFHQTDNLAEVISRKRRRQLTAEARNSRFSVVSESDGFSSEVQQQSETVTAADKKRYAARQRNRIGTATTTVAGMQAASDLVRKKVYCVNNASSTTTCTSMLQFLSTLQIRCISCFDSKTRYKNARAFRVCINDNDRGKFINMSLWPPGIIIRDWVFKPKNISNEDAAASIPVSLSVPSLGADIIPNLITDTSSTVRQEDLATNFLPTSSVFGDSVPTSADSIVNNASLITNNGGV